MSLLEFGLRENIASAWLDHVRDWFVEWLGLKSIDCSLCFLFCCILLGNDTHYAINFTVDVLKFFEPVEEFLLLEDDISTADMIVVGFYVILLFGPAFIRKYDFWEHIKGLVAKIASQIMDVWVPIFVHPKCPLLYWIKSLCHLHEAWETVVALIELPVTLVYINLEVFRHWTPCQTFIAAAFFSHSHQQPMWKKYYREEH